MKFINWVRSKERLRNGAMWVSLSAQGLIAAQIGARIFHYSLTAEMSSDVSLFVNAFLLILSTLGIISNPAKPDSKGFNL